MDSVFNKSLLSAEIALKDKDFVEQVKENKKKIVNCINKGDESLALELISEFQIETF
jgi:predicted GTPase